MNARPAPRGPLAALALSIACVVACGAAADRAPEGQSHEAGPGDPEVESIDATLEFGAASVAADQATLEPLRRAVESAPDDYDARRQLAIALHERNLAREAVEQFERALQLRENVRSLLDVALAYSAASMVDESEAAYRRILELEPEHAIARHNLGNVAFKRGDLSAAIEHYRRSLAIKPDYLMAQYHLAKTLERIGRHRDAYIEYNRVLALTPSASEELEFYDDALYQMATLDMMMGQPARAAEMLETLIQERPDHYGAHYSYAQVLLQLGREDEARAQLEIHQGILASRNPIGPVATKD